MDNFKNRDSVYVLIGEKFKDGKRILFVPSVISSNSVEKLRRHMRTIYNLEFDSVKNDGYILDSSEYDNSHARIEYHSAIDGSLYECTMCIVESTVI